MVEGRVQITTAPPRGGRVARRDPRFRRERATRPITVAHAPHATRARRGFTLIELLLVVLVVAIAGSAVLAAFARSSPARRELGAVRAMHASLAQARAEAMRSAAPRSVVITQGDGDEPRAIAASAFGPDPIEEADIRRDADGGASFAIDDGRRAVNTLDAHGLVLIDRDVQPLRAQRVVFDAAGRSRTRLLAWRSADASPRTLRNSDLLTPAAYRSVPKGVDLRAGLGADDVIDLTTRNNQLDDGRLWLVLLDPVSGDPRIRGVGAGVPTRLLPDAFGGDAARTAPNAARNR